MRISYWKHIEITVHVVKRKRILEGQVPIRKMCWQRWRSRPLSFSLLIWPTLACKSYLIIPQWSRLRSGSQILDFNFRFCDNYACICFFHRLVVFHRNRHGTAWELPVCKYIPSMDCDGKPLWRQTWMKWWKLHCAAVSGSSSTACWNMLGKTHFCAAWKLDRGWG